jgi:hypothetical protein
VLVGALCGLAASLVIGVGFSGRCEKGVGWVIGTGRVIVCDPMRGLVGGGVMDRNLGKLQPSNPHIPVATCSWLAICNYFFQEKFGYKREIA